MQHRMFFFLQRATGKRLTLNLVERNWWKRGWRQENTVQFRFLVTGSDDPILSSDKRNIPVNPLPLPPTRISNLYTDTFRFFTTHIDLSVSLMSFLMKSVWISLFKSPLSPTLIPRLVLSSLKYPSQRKQAWGLYPPKFYGKLKGYKAT